MIKCYHTVEGTALSFVLDRRVWDVNCSNKANIDTTTRVIHKFDHESKTASEHTYGKAIVLLGLKWKYNNASCLPRSCVTLNPFLATSAAIVTTSFQCILKNKRGTRDGLFWKYVASAKPNIRVFMKQHFSLVLTHASGSFTQPPLSSSVVDTDKNLCLNAIRASMGGKPP